MMAEDLREKIEDEILSDREGIVERNEAMSCTARSRRILKLFKGCGIWTEKELPKCPVEYYRLACGAEDDTDNFYRDGYLASQQDMIQYIKECFTPIE